MWDGKRESVCGFGSLQQHWEMLYENVSSQRQSKKRSESACHLKERLLESALKHFGSPLPTLDKLTCEPEKSSPADVI